MTKDKPIPLLELRRLLYELRELAPAVCIRFRFIGDMWQTNHCRILKLTEKGVVLNDETSNKLLFIQDLSNIMQFELDQKFQQYEPHHHYSIDVSLNY